MVHRNPFQEGQERVNFVDEQLIKTNDNGQPIVETPQDAINTFKNIDLDYLVIGNYLVSKK